MKPPLAILGRHSGAIVLREGSAPEPSGPDFEGGPLLFSGMEEAAAYLSFWLSDEAAMVRLRRALHEAGHSREVRRCSDRQVVRALAARIASGAIEVVPDEEDEEFLDVRAAFAKAAAASAKPSVRPAAAVPVVPEVPAVPDPPLLPLLEEVQIEGAEVLPEVLQTLEQIDISLGTLDMAALSLEPAPTAVPGIASAMTEASASVTETLDAL